MGMGKVTWNRKFLSKSGADSVIRSEMMKIATGIEDAAARASTWDSGSGLTDPRQQAGYRAEAGRGMAAVVTVLNATPARQRRLRIAARKNRGGK